MADRTDIDALLIGALYGELTPADDARLTAHLESHPADRTALADLTRTREAVRESRFLAVQLELPQSVSARLLQEAARLSARPAERAGQSEGWFFRFTRTFMAHPAMAVAAMLVLVVGVAGTLYVRHGDRLADMAAPVSATDRDRAFELSQAKPAAAPEAVQPGQSDGTKNVAVTAGVGAAAGTGSGGSDSYRAALDEVSGDQAAERQKAAQSDRPVASSKSEAIAVGAGTAVSPAEVSRDPAKPVPPARKLAKRAGPGGIELRSPELQPKDVDDDRQESQRNDEKKDVGDRVATNSRPSPAPSAVVATPPAPANKPPAATSPALDQNPLADDGRAQPAPGKTVSRGVPQQAAPAPSGGAASSNRRSEPAAGAASKGADADANDKALVAWVRKQHDLVVSLVRSSNCRAAASAAIEIYNRAPGYYDASVANDRSVKPCLAYLNSEREREERRFAAKRAMSTEAPAAAPAAPPPATEPPPARK